MSRVPAGFVESLRDFFVRAWPLLLLALAALLIALMTQR
jgi:hypothetical protein